MSRPVDEKIVSLKIDNKDFEANAKTSLSTFAKLTSVFKTSDSLDLKKSTTSLADLKNQANSIDMNLLNDALETVKWRFSTLGVMATEVLQSITHKILETASSMAKGLLVTPMMDGLSEYELKMKSIQTIMSNTEGKHSIEEVGVVLNDLNEYADKTIYNFAEMTRNVGLFTTAGVSLEDSATAIKGISNLSAAVGADAQASARGMYQLSQALGSGVVKLMDWKSVENAGMGGKLFQNALLDKAKSMDIYVDESVKFRESLSKEWLTTDVLIATLEDFANDEMMLEAATKVRTFTQLIDTTKEALGSGWATSWEKLIGDFDQAGQRFTKLSEQINDKINASADKRNAYFETLNKAGFGVEVFNTIGKGLAMIFSYSTAIGNIIKKIFPMPDAYEMTNIVWKLGLLFEKLTISPNSNRAVKILASTFGTLASVARILVTVLAQAAKGLVSLVPTALFSMFSRLKTAITDSFISIENFVKGFEQMLKGSTYIADAFLVLKKVLGDTFAVISEKVSAVTSKFDLLKVVSGLLGSVLLNVTAIFAKNGSALTLMTAAGDKVKAAYDKMSEAIKEWREGLTPVSEVLEKAKGHLDKFSEALHKIKEQFKQSEPPVERFKRALEGLKTLLDFLGDVIMAVWDKLKELIKTATGEDLTQVGIFAALVLIYKTFKSFSKTAASFAESFEDLSKKASKVLKDIGKSFKAFTRDVKANALVKIAAAVVILAIGIKMLADLDPKQALVSIGVLTIGLIAITAALFAISKISGLNDSGIYKIVAVAAAVALLALGLKMVGELPIEQMIPALAVLVGVIAALVLAIAVLSAAKGELTSGVLTLIALSGAIVIMSFGLQELAKVPVDKIEGSLLLLAGATIALALLGAVVGASGITVGKALAIAAAAAALLIMVEVINQLKDFSVQDLTKGVLTIGGLLVGIGLFGQLTQNNKGMIQAAASIAIIAGAMILMEISIKAITSLDTDTIIEGFIIIGMLLIGIAYAANLASWEQLLALSVSIAVLAISFGKLAKGLDSLAHTAQFLGELDWVSLTKGIGGLVVLIVALGAAMYLMGDAGSAVGLLAVTIAIRGLVPAIKEFADIEWSTLGKALTFFGLGLGALVLAAGAITAFGLGPALVILAGAIIALGVAVLAAGAGIYLFATALQIMGSMSEAETNRVLDNVGAFIIGILSFIPDLVLAGVEIIAAFIRGIRSKAKDVIANVLGIFTDLLKAVADNAEKWTKIGIDILLAVGRGLIEKMPQLVELAVVLFITFLRSLAETIINNDGDILDAIGGLILAIGILIAGALDGIIKTLTGFDLDLAGKLKGMAENGSSSFKKNLDLNTPSKTELGKVDKSVDDAKKKIPIKTGDVADTMKGKFKSNLNGIGDITTQNFVNPAIAGVDSGKGKISAAGGNLAKNGKWGFEEISTYWSGANFGYGLANGIDSTIDAVRAAARRIAVAGSTSVSHYLVEYSPSRRLFKSGQNFGQGFANGITDKESETWDSAKALAKGAVDKVKAYADEFSSALSEYMDAEPVIKPILNLDNFDKESLNFLGKEANINLSGQGFAGTAENLTNRFSGDNAPIQNSYIYEVNNARMLEGSTFYVREEADIEKIAIALERRTSETFTKKGLRVVTT